MLIPAPSNRPLGFLYCYEFLGMSMDSYEFLWITEDSPMSYASPMTCLLRNMKIKHSTDMNHTILFGRHSKESSCFQTRYSQDAETTIHILHCRQTISRLKQTIASLKIKHSIDMNITILYANFSAWSMADQTMVC